jgi:nucleoside-diphosphate-sugar epimerase
MAILVTGATGRIGKHLVKALLERNEQVRILVRGNEKIDFENVEVIYGDITDRETVRKAMDGCDTVYHLAALVDYLAPKDIMYKVNVLGTKNVAELGEGYNPKDNPITENTPCKPSNLYGRTKYFAEKYILEADGIVIRAPIVFGKEFTNGFYEMFSLLQDNKFPLVGSGKNFIHWIHVNDLVNALLLAMDKGKSKEIYLVAGKEVKTLRELLEITCKFLNTNMPTKTASKTLVSLAARYKVFISSLTKEKPMLIPAYVDKLVSNRTYDIEKSERELGFKPQMDYEAGIKEMVEEFLKDKQNNVAVKQGNNQS